ncbi:hypothetical protein [Salidesulfovibrio brasiliensis]|uniref:hypothetical protein n=1 Tax=Salidesulfovibrio brasiliensis TaxID=221711 RepID=UPI0006D1F489|nr:hypothetical protein [Salidesulfovibrio brasiliensis]
MRPLRRLAAFFVFVGVSLTVALAPADTAGSASDNGTQPIRVGGGSPIKEEHAEAKKDLPPGVVAEEGLLKISYSAKMIGNGKYLPEGNMTAVCKEIVRRFDMHDASKVALIGHASCKTKYGMHRNQSKEYTEFSDEFDKDFGVNARFSALRALELFQSCLECKDKATRNWFNSNRDIILIEGRSEIEAGLNMDDGVPWCLNRKLPDEAEARYRRIDVQFIRAAKSPPSAE